MKRKILVLSIVIAMMASLLVACGDNAHPTSNDAQTSEQATPTPETTPEVKPTTEPTMEPEDGTINDSGVLEDVPMDESNENGNTSLGEVSNMATRYDCTEQLPDGVEAWSDVYPFVDNVDMARHYTYFKNVNGNTMFFVWDAPTIVGINFGLSDDGKTLNMGDSETPTYRFYALTGKISNESEMLKNYDSNIIMRAGIGGPDESSFQIIEDNDEIYRIVFKETMSAFGKNYIGFACFFDDYETSMCLQFEYFIEESAYDEDMVLNTISSITRIDLEEYESTLTTNE